MDLLIWLTWELLGKIHRSILLQERFFAGLGGGGRGGTQERFSNFSNNRLFQAEKLPENLVSKEEYYRQHNFKPNKLFKLEQIWRRQLHS